jgi:MoaA/NifB/PqqE/SkfB family radical SAM enzyme
MIAENKNDIIELRKKQTQYSENSELIPLNALQSITINPTELCNRTCHFCPRSDASVYPNQNLHISEETVRNISTQLKINNYRNRIGWSGNGEPLLAKNFLNLVNIISSENPQIETIELNTNGDKLSSGLIKDIYDSGINHIIVSVYDGDNSLNKFLELFKNYDSNTYTLRKSYYHSDNFTGFTNRAGAVKLNEEKITEYKTNKCYLPFYKLFIDWNGDIIVCCEDWFKLSKTALNINTHSLEEIWTSDFLNTYRKNLKEGNRNLKVCNRFNINGEKVGKEYVNFFKL